MILSIFLAWTQPASGPAETEDNVLIRQALAGRSAAVDTLVRRLMPVLRARVRRATKKGGLGPHGPDDLVQEVWLALIADGGRRLLAYDPERGMTLEGYVGLLAEREIGQRRRSVMAQKRGGHLRVVDSDAVETASAPQASPEEAVTGKNLAARLGEHLEAELPEKGQLVFRYAFTDGHPPTEVARIMGVKVQVVYNWQHKIRSLARSFLAADSSA